VKGHSFEGWTQYEVKSGAELEGLAGITMWLVWCWLVARNRLLLPGATGWHQNTPHVYFSHRFALLFDYLFIMMSVNRIFTMKYARFTYH
jgi:hypothetical protein